MSWKILRPSVKELCICGLAGATSLFWWSSVKDMVQPHLSEEFAAFTGLLTFWGFFLSMGAMRLGLVSPSHPLRVVGYFVGALSFLLNLLVQQNDGNVFLEVALVVATSRKLLTAQPSQDAFKPWKWRWLVAIPVLVFAYWAGGAVQHIWPYGKSYLLPQEGWSAIALSGAAILLWAVILLQEGILDGNGWRFATLYAIGTTSLVISYLGQRSDAGLRLNVALSIVMVASIIISAIRKH